MTRLLFPIGRCELLIPLLSLMKVVIKTILFRKAIEIDYKFCRPSKSLMAIVMVFAFMVPVALIKSETQRQYLQEDERLINFGQIGDRWVCQPTEMINERLRGKIPNFRLAK